LGSHELDFDVSCGFGHIGDLVVGCVLPVPPNQKEVRIFLPHSLSSSQNTTTVSLHFPSPVRVIAPLGNRQSTTHANGGVPPDGLHITATSTTPQLLSWLVPESGMVGLLYCESADANVLAEHALPFSTIGLLKYPHTHQRAGQNVNLSDLVLPLPSHSLPLTIQKPIIFVTATSAEAGKTTLSCKLIKMIREKV
jgi:hypothetical protein